MKTIPHRLYLSEDQIPTHYFNLRSAMPEQPDPMLNPGILQPVKEEELYPIFCEALAHQEMDGSTEFVEIPEEIREVYKMYRPSPLVRAYHLERALGTPAKLYYKFEGNNTSGSHKLNSAVAQAYYARTQGIARLTMETGAGQWGTALSEVCSSFGPGLDVFMVKCSYEQKPFRKDVMRVFGGRVTPSPSMTTEVGKKILAMDPETTGSLGCAISEAVESAVSHPNSRYVLGSVLNQVLLHQSIIGLESETTMEQLGEYPDIVVGCAGGGSNLGGLIAPFMRDKLTGKHTGARFVAVEPASCPSLTRGRYAYDFCDTGKVTPMARMYTLGAGFIPSANHAGGLRCHGMSPILSKLYHEGYMEAVSDKQTEVFEAAVQFAKLETILPAPESARAIKGAMDAALKCRETGEAKTILFGLTETGYFDMTAYAAYQDGRMTDHVPTDEELQKGFDSLPDIPQNR